VARVGGSIHGPRWWQHALRRLRSVVLSRDPLPVREPWLARSVIPLDRRAGLSPGPGKVRALSARILEFKKREPLGLGPSRSAHRGGHDGDQVVGFSRMSERNIAEGS